MFSMAAISLVLSRYSNLTLLVTNILRNAELAGCRSQAQRLKAAPLVGPCHASKKPTAAPVFLLLILPSQSQTASVSSKNGCERIAPDAPKEIHFGVHPLGSSDQRCPALALAAWPPRKNLGAASCPMDLQIRGSRYPGANHWLAHIAGDPRG